MKKGSWLALAAVALLIGTAARGALGFIIAAALVGVPYLLSCTFNPRTRHNSGWGHCNGTGEVPGWFFRWSFHRCGKCQSGRVIKLGARYAGPERIRNEWRYGKAARKTAKQQHRWR